MFPLRRIGAVFTAFALSVTTLSTGLVPCTMVEGHARDQTVASTAHSHHASTQARHHDVAPGAHASDMQDETGTPPSCPVMGPCSLHLLASAQVGGGGAADQSGRVAVSPVLAPPTRNTAPELPPPRA